MEQWKLTPGELRLRQGISGLAWRLAAQVVGAALAGGALNAAGLGSAEAEPSPERFYWFSTRFEDGRLPAGWMAVGDWRVTDEGLRPPAAGSFATWAGWAVQTAVENTLLECWFVLEAPDTQIGLVRRDLSRPFTRADVAGSLGLWDAASGRLALHSAWDGTNAPPVLAATPVPFVPVVGREYKLALWKTDAGHHGLGLWDTRTGERAVVATVRRPGHDPGKQLDAPGVLLARGAARITRLDFCTAFPRQPRLLVLGDSTGEGEALKPDYEARYCKLALRDLAGSAVLASRGRENSRALQERLAQDLAPFSLEYVLVALGTAEVSAEDWWVHLQEILARLEAAGAVPLLATLPPAEHRIPFNREVNQRVRESGRRFVDFARALGRDDEGLYWDFSLQVDGIHPNVTGYRRMYERLRADVPELFAPVQPAPLRQVRLLPVTAEPGTPVRLPIELTGRGAETLLAFSLAADPAFLRLTGISRGRDLPAAARVETFTRDLALGRVGVRVSLPPGQFLPAGAREILAVDGLATSRPPAARSPVRITDDPEPRCLLEFGLDAWMEGEVRFLGRFTPAAHWPLDGTARDASGGEHHGQTRGGLWGAGRLDGALSLNGVHDHVALTNPPRLGIGEPLTLAAWIRPVELEGTRTVAGVASDLGAGGVVLRLHAGRYQFGRAGPPEEEWAEWSAPARDENRWVHLAGVCDGRQWRLFRNGVEVAARSLRAPGAGGLLHFLGAGGDGEEGFFSGALDDVRFYRHALAEGEIEALAGLEPPLAGTDEVWLDDALPPGAAGIGHGGDTGEWVSTDPPPVSGARSLRSPAAPGLHSYYFGGRAPGWGIEPGDALVAYVYLDPARPPRMILLQWQDDAGGWEHRAFWGEPLWPYGQDTTLARHEMGPLPPVGQWVRLVVPALWVGLEGRRVRGLGVVAFDGAAHWDHFGRNCRARELTWVMIGLPPETRPDPADRLWQWREGSLAPFAGLPVHESPPDADGRRLHGLVRNDDGWLVNAGDSLFAWVFLEPGDEPDFIALAWRDESGAWEHRAVWGEALPAAAPADGPAHRRMGPLPAAGRWTRLSVPAGLVDLGGRRVTGLRFEAQGGLARWARAGRAEAGIPAVQTPELRVERQPPDRVRLRFDLNEPRTVTLEGSDDLVGWRPLRRFAGAAGPNALADWLAPDEAQRFYRLRLEP